MFKKIFMLFKIGRKLSTSGAIFSIYEIYSPPILVKIFMNQNKGFSSANNETLFKAWVKSSRLTSAISELSEGMT